MYLPSVMRDVRLHSRFLNGNKFSTSKISIKQSYIILVWTYYLSNRSQNRHNLETESDVKHPVSKDRNTKIPSFFIYPPRKSKFTLTKSPMAHKTFSQEQFFYKNFRLSVSFFCFVPRNGVINGAYSSLYFAISVLNNIPNPSTNMFLLQRYTVFYLSRDPSFFSFFEFYNCVKTRKKLF